jgi:chemotaxis signal transduction protein
MTPGDARQGIRLGLMSTGGITVGLDVTCVAEVWPVRDVSPLLSAAPGLLGAIDLRGHQIPLFDPLPLAGLAPRGAEPRIAVVAARDGRRVALGFDAIEGLVQVPRDRLERHAGTEGAFFAGTLETGGRIVSVVEPRALLSRPDIPTASAGSSGVRGSAALALPVLTFDTGDARFGIAASGVEATVPRQSIEMESLADGAWLGIIRHHGRRVPVMHLNAVLGIGEVRDLRMAEVVIVRFPDRRLVGFAVENIRRMQLVSVAAARPVPAMLAVRTLAIRQVVPDAADCDTFLIDLDALRADRTLSGMASLSDEEPGATPAPAAADADGARIERDRYLVARAGAPVAIPIRQVARIVMPPPQVTPLARAPDWVRGVFREDAATVPLIDLGHRLGHGRTEVSERTRVLLTGSREALTGFTVGGVDHLEWSGWRSDRAGGDDMLAGLVGFPRLGAQGVVPIVDLARFEATAGHG